ncbi:hypothetical protein FISHEDRAFT_17830, partial [Fistulina hepatica ATCC 64428]
PKPRMKLDADMQALLRDVDMAMLNYKIRPTHITELEALPRTAETSELVSYDGEADDDLDRKSPAALFGSARIGSVVLPVELQNAVDRVINSMDKSQLQSDARRLFEEEQGNDNAWSTTYDKKYRSHVQARRHFERDSAAFVSVALPAHYSAVFAVLDHVKKRLGSEFVVERVLEWGSGAGSALWATYHSFQQPTSETNIDLEDLRLSNSTITSYLSIERREGLSTMAKRLVADSEGSGMIWQRTYHDDDRIPRTQAADTMAISAFHLTSVKDAASKKALIKEMWDSGAHTIVLIDHNTAEGFGSIVEARQALLKMGEREMEDPETAEWPIRGCHVLAPCPHDGKCPLHHPGAIKLVCGFEQRLQRPAFVRKTKGSGRGHEDIGYSYVVIRRGPRPSPATTALGRIGQFGRRELEKDAHTMVKPRELQQHSEEEHIEARAQPSSAEIADDLVSARLKQDTLPPAELEVALRAEAYSWPRLVFPPIKNSGHIIIDGCTNEGTKIMRMTIPRSQGKQPFYDARKSHWGDIFPHPPKNPPQERYQPSRSKNATSSIKSAEIGKRGQEIKHKDRTSYKAISEDIKDKAYKRRK